MLAIDGGAGNNTVIATNDVNYTISNTQLGRGSVASVTMSNINLASLMGGASDNLFNVSNFSGSGTLIGGGGNDTIITSGGSYANITLSNSSLVEDTQNFSLTGFSTANLAVTSSNTTFNLAGWTGSAVVNGGTGNSTLAGPNGVQTPNQWIFNGLNQGRSTRTSR